MRALESLDEDLHLLLDGIAAAARTASVAVIRNGFQSKKPNAQVKRSRSRKKSTKIPNFLVYIQRSLVLMHTH